MKKKPISGFLLVFVLFMLVTIWASWEARQEKERQSEMMIELSREKSCGAFCVDEHIVLDDVTVTDGDITVTGTITWGE